MLHKFENTHQSIFSAEQKRSISLTECALLKMQQSTYKQWNASCEVVLNKLKNTMSWYKTDRNLFLKYYTLNIIDRISIIKMAVDMSRWRKSVLCRNFNISLFVMFFFCIFLLNCLLTWVSNLLWRSCGNKLLLWK